MAKKKGSLKTSKTISKEFEISIAPWDGMVTSQDPFSIPENSSLWIEGLPKLTGAIESVPKPSTKYTHSATILDYFSFQLSDTYHCFLDGAKLYFLNKTFVPIANYSTTASKCDYGLQGSSAVWVVTRDFLITFDGSTIYNLSGRNVFGDAICYWKGRIFIGKDRTITFTVPDPDYTNVNDPFDTSGGAGFITINIGSFSQIRALIPKEDSIYIFTDNNILALLGTTISNDPTQWYLTEIVSGHGLTGIRKLIKYEHTIFYHSNLGVMSIVATAPEKIDDTITNLTNSISGIAVFIYNGIPYVAVIAQSYINPSNNVIYCYNLLFSKWYALPTDIEHISTCQNNTYGAKGTDIIKLFDANTYYPVKVKTKTFFNLEQLYYNLRTIYLYGRGNNLIDCAVYDETSKQTIFNYQQMGLVSNSFLFYNSYGSFLFYNPEGPFMFAQTPGFFLNTYKNYSSGYTGLRMKQFYLTLESQDNGVYTEFISVKIKGTIGARYV